MEINLCECSFYSASKLGRIFSNKTEEIFASLGLGGNYALLLTALYDFKSVTPLVIADAISLSPSTITRFVDKLILKGYVIKEISGKNSFISLTKKGEEIYPDLLEGWKRLKEYYIEFLGEDLYNKYIEINKEVLSKLDEKN